MSAPTFVGSYLTAFNTATSPKSSAAFDVATGDVVIAGVCDEQADASENFTYGNSGTSLGWTEDTAATFVAGGDTFIQTATAVAPGAQTGITGTLTRTTGDASHVFGGMFARFSNASVTGTARAQSTAPDTSSPYTLSITPVYPNSAILYGMADYAALDFSARVHQTVNGYTPVAGGAYEIHYHRSAVDFSLCWAYIPDAGAAGEAKVVGMTGPAAGDVLMVAVEIAGPPPVQDEGTKHVYLTYEQMLAMARRVG